jgi:hypothetical protein
MSFMPAVCCTSLVATGKATASGRPMLWKHRDTGAPSNFLARVEARAAGEFGYVGLFNAGDSLLAEAWTGMNDAGFAIMNTASYNLAPDTTAYKDREALVMSAALRRCRSVDDFATLLDTLPRPLGVQANFGVIDGMGQAAYFETYDHGYRRYDADESTGGCLIRTNFSISGKQNGTGRGYIRYESAHALLDSTIASGGLTPELLTDTVSRSFYHSGIGRDPLKDGDRIVEDKDFIPRKISTASIVIEGVLADESPAEGMRMRAALGYPPLAKPATVSLGDIPPRLGADLPGHDSSASREANALRDQVFIKKKGGGRADRIDLDKLRELMKQ